MKNHFLVEGNEGNREIKEGRCFLDSFLVPSSCQLKESESEIDVYACCTKRILLTISGIMIGAILILLVWLR